MTESYIRCDLCKNMFLTENPHKVPTHRCEGRKEKNPLDNVEHIANGTWTSSGDLLGATWGELKICNYAKQILDEMKNETELTAKKRKVNYCGMIKYNFSNLKEGKQKYCCELHKIFDEHFKEWNKDK